LIAEQAVLNFRSLNAACDAAADGKVFAVAETLALQQGRELVRRTVEVALQQQTQGLEKKFAAADLRVRTDESESRPQSPVRDDVGGRSAVVARVPALRPLPDRRVRTG